MLRSSRVQGAEQTNRNPPRDFSARVAIMERRRILAPLCLLLLVGVVAGEKGKELQEKLQEAEEAQEFREEAFGPVVSDIISQAPPAELANGDGDVATTGNCGGDIDHFCVDIMPGEGRLSDCLTKQIQDEENGNTDGRKVSEDCKVELRAFKADRATNINKNIELAVACKEDADKFCNDENLYPEPGAVITCLREVKDKLSETCKEEITMTQLEAAEDMAMDVMLSEMCQKDADTLCSDVKPGGGRIQECLRDKRASLSWDCQEELFRQEVENADDIRLNVRLFNACLNDRKKFCKNKKYGNAQVKDCLEDKREKPGFSAECKNELEKMMERRATDFRLDSTLRETCKNDIDEICGYEKDSLDSIAGYDARVIQCLQDYKEDLQGEECKASVHKLTERAAQDIRFDEPLADACFEDRARLCEGVTPGSARVIRCLQDQREELSYECRATLFDQEVRFAEDIDFKYPMRIACQEEVQKFCDKQTAGHARIIRCLQEHVDDEEMSAECKEEVVRDENRQNQDYRLNYRLNVACELDIDELCAEQCSPFLGHACGGTVLRCLSDNQEKISSEECKTEVTYFQLMEVTDFRNDIILAETCRQDVDQYCDTIEPGEGRVHACLRDHRDKISEACAAEELKLEKIESESTDLQPRLNKLCSEERTVFCKNVKAGNGRVFKCLEENMAKPDFSTSCRTEVEKRQLRMQENWQLDYGVSHECKTEVDSICAEAKGRAHENAAVLLCLVQNFDKVGDNCQTEMSRSVRMALWAYTPGAHLTAACDDDVKANCKIGKSRGIFSIGAVGRCLSRRLAEEKSLSGECRTLVSVAAPKDAAALFQNQGSTSMLAGQMAELQRMASSASLINPTGSGTSFITLTGWVALASILALVVLVLFAGFYGYRRYSGAYKPYTMVYKSGDI